MDNANRYWLNEEEKNSILCGKEDGRLEHFIGQCEVSKLWFDQMAGFVQEKINRSVTEKRDVELMKIWRKVDKEQKKLLRLKRKVKRKKRKI